MIPANIVDNEIRYALISKILTKCFVVIFSIREDTNRIISVRRCRKNEEKNYENKTNFGKPDFSLTNQPNYQIMETFISAIQKLVIKDVVLYADEKIATSKEVVNDK